MERCSLDSPGKVRSGRRRAVQSISRSSEEGAWLLSAEASDARGGETESMFALRRAEGGSRKQCTQSMIEHSRRRRRQC